MAMYSNLFGEENGWQATGGTHAVQIRTGNDYIHLFPYYAGSGKKDWSSLADALSHAAKLAEIESLKAKLAGDSVQEDES